jgi:rubrerythrin
MQRYIEACAEGEGAERLVRVLGEIIAEPELHARFVNTLARLEYVGVRKMLKSRRSELLTIEGLQHILDEAVHALRLKKAATALGASVGARVITFSDHDTLAGDAGEDYLQAIDSAAEAVVHQEWTPARRAEANYLLTSAAIEVRAQIFYPIYDRLLAERKVGFSVAAIAKDEDRHLSEMAEGLGRAFADWRAVFEPLLAAEERLFCGFMDAVRAAMERERAVAA